MNVGAQGGEGLPGVEPYYLERELLVAPGRQQVQVRKDQDRLHRQKERQTVAEGLAQPGRSKSHARRSVPYRRR